MLISIIYVNYNLSSDIIDSISSVSRFMEMGSYEVIIVDNKSTNDEQNMIEEYSNNYEYVRHIKNATNLGFGKACNIGVKQAAGEYVLFLNPDVIVKRLSVKSLINSFYRNPNLALLGLAFEEHPLFYFSAGIFPNLLTELMNVFAIGRYVEALFSRIKILMKPGNCSIQFDWVIGAGFVIKKEIFIAVGSFSEDYFMYFEEVDLCHRLKINKKMEIELDKNSKLVHLGSKASKKDYEKFTYNFYLGKLKFYKNNYSKFRFYQLYLILLKVSLKFLLGINIIMFENQIALAKNNAIRRLLREEF